ncbi:MAG: hypothetical protein Q8R16_03900 [bacterium]|nr:hypothetical protein [bacterium]
MLWFIFALIYVAAGVPIGFGYAFFTGASEPSRPEVVAWAATFGPAVLMVIAAFRDVSWTTGEPFARLVYHTLLVTFAAPMLMFGISLLANAAGLELVAQIARALRYWSIPLVFVTAAGYGLWRVTKQFDRAHGATGGPGATPPSGSGGSGTRSTTAQRAEGDRSLPPGALRRTVEALG